MMKHLIEKLKEKEPRMIEIRRYLHQHPELSFHEKETPKYIESFYEGKDCKVETNVGPNGLKVTIDSGNQVRRLQFALILMLYQFKKIQD